MSKKSVRFSSKLMVDGFTMVPNLVLRSDALDVYAKTLYALLADYAGQDEECWPGQDGLRKRLGCSERKLRDATRDLETAGFISAHQRGRGNTNTYVLLALEEIDDRQEVPVSRGFRPAGGAGLDRQEVPVPCEQDSVEQDIEKTSSSLVDVPDQVDEIFREWQEECHHPQAKLSPERRRAIQARLREGATREEFRAAIAGAARAAHVNDNGQRFDDIELICRNRVKFDSFIARATAVPQTSERDQLHLKDAAVLKRVIGAAR